MSATVLIVQSDNSVAERLGQLILAGTPNAQVGAVSTGHEAIGALQSYKELDLVLCEINLEDGLGLAFLSAVRTRFRAARVIIVTAYDLQNFADYIQGLTVFSLPVDEAAFSITCQDALETLEGLEFPPFRLGEKQPPDRWGDCYAAYDTGVKRDVFITLLRAGSTEEEAKWFGAAAMSMAQAVHPNVQAVYQGGQFQGRDFFAREKWDMPNLSEMATAGQRIEGRLAARIVQIVGSVIIFWDANGFPHTPVGSVDVTVSTEGITKVSNCVDPRLEPTPPGTADLTGLAHALQALLPPAEEVPERVQALLARLMAGPVPVAEVVGEAQGIDIELAPERHIAVTQERKVARVAIHVERKKQNRNFYITAGVTVAAVLAIAYLIYARFFAPPSFHVFNQMAYVPAGDYVFQDGPAKMDHSFYIDKYEVTLGEYLLFLKAVDRAGTDEAWRAPGQTGEKNHEPTDWGDHMDGTVLTAGIFSSIVHHQAYHHEYITLDYPVFNIDWYDAMAYAKWAGKRLPTEHEWELAGRGPKGNLYPWGNTFATNANTAVPAPGTEVDVDVARTQTAVDATSSDKSYYGVYNMAGNVSEWTADIVPSSMISSINVAVIRGGNFNTRREDHEKMTYRSTNFVQNTRQPWLGFRCASDNYVTLPSK